MKRPKSSRFASITTRLLFVIGFTNILVVSPAPVYSEESPGAFETLTLGVHFLTDVGQSSFQKHWSPTPGGRVEVGTPFYLGIIQTGLHVFRNDGVTRNLPAFDSFYLYLGWGYEWKLPFALHWFLGVRAGGFYMDFDDDSLPDEVKTESELGWGFDTRLRYPFANNWSVVGTAEYEEILTHRRIEYVFLGVGIDYAMTTPRWLREFLE